MPVIQHPSRIRTVNVGDRGNSLIPIADNGVARHDPYNRLVGKRFGSFAFADID